MTHRHWTEKLAWPMIIGALIILFYVMRKQDHQHNEHLKHK